jgi:excisionase family DNA binding protein
MPATALTTPSDPSQAKLLLTVREAAAVLSISERSLWERTRRGEVLAVKIGRSKRYARGELERYVARLREEQAAQHDGLPR